MFDYILECAEQKEEHYNKLLKKYINKEIRITYYTIYLHKDEQGTFIFSRFAAISKR